MHGKRYDETAKVTGWKATRLFLISTMSEK